MNYPNIFKPGKIGNLDIKNRIVFPPMEILGAGFNGEMSDDMIAYYEERAKSGVGLIITAYASVDDEYSQSFAGAQLKLTDPKHTSAMSKLARVMHKYDTKVWTQIYMAGRQAVPSRITGKRMIAPSPIGYSCHDQIPEEMTLEEIKSAVKKHGKAALILKNADMDGVEILAAGGYMVNQFMSDYSNKRKDEYGGSFENKMRFLKEIIEEIRMRCGPEFAISVRFDADEFTEGGYGLEEGIRIAKYLESLGVDALNVQNGNQEKRYYIIEPVTFKTGWKSYISKAIKEAVSIPVIATSVIKLPEQAEKLLKEGAMDFAAVGRGIYADPQWVKKAKEGRQEDIKPCIGCLYCLEQTAKFRRSTCAVNCRAAREQEFPPAPKNLCGKSIIVVGSGPAGMEAAVVLANRDAKVTVLEKNNYVGGSIELAARTPDKEPIRNLIRYYENQAKKLGIDVKLNTEATKDVIRSYDPYAVFVATGGTPIIPQFEGIEHANVITVPMALKKGYKETGKKIVVIGGGMTGCEVAEHFALMGNEVTLVEMMDKLAPEVDPDNLVTVIRNLKKTHADIITKTKVTALAKDHVTALNTETGEKLEIPADLVILSLGNCSENKLFEELSSVYERIYMVGDAKKVGRVANAVHTAYQTAYLFDNNF